MASSSFCPYFDFRPEGNHGFTLIPFQAKVVCSEDCVVLTSFLWGEAAGYPSYIPPPDKIQQWVRTGLLSYAHLFVRTLTTIPVDLIPPASHISNIDMQIEGRMVAVDFKTNEAIFKLDNTSARKLEVFYSELTDREPSRDLTLTLDNLRVRMAMADVIGYKLLGFNEVVGRLFDVDTQNTLGSLENVREEDTSIHNVQEEWTSFCQSLYGHQCDQFLSTEYKADSGEGKSLEAAVRDYFEDGQLETFPQDAFSCPQPYWDLTDVTMPPSGCSEEVDNWSSMTQPRDQESMGFQASPDTELVNNTMMQFTRGTPKPYGCLGYIKPARVLRVPPTPPLVSCVDPTSPSVFTLPEPVLPTSSFVQRQSGREFSYSSPLYNTKISTVITPESMEDSEQETTYRGSQLPRQSLGSSLDSESEVTTPSNGSTDPSPYVFDTRHTTPPTSDALDSDLLIFSPCSPMWMDSEYPADVQCKRSEKRQKRRIRKLPLTVTRGLDKVKGIGFLNIPLKSELFGQTDDDYQPQPSMSDGGNEIKNKNQVEEELNEYGFESEDESGFALPPMKAEKELDSTEVLIQGKMEAMFDAAELEGIVCRATRDGLDNHPISVRLRSISGTRSSMKTILGEQPYNSAVARTSNVLENEMDPEHNEESVSPPFSLEGINKIGTLESKYKIPNADCQSSVESGNYIRSSASPEFLSNTHSSKSPRSNGPMDLDVQQFSKYKVAVKTPTERLKALKHKFEHDAEQMLGSYRRTLRRIQILEEEINKSETRELKEIEAKAREMIEYCGYDESAFTLEGNVSKSAIQRDSHSTLVSQCTDDRSYERGVLDSFSSTAGYKGPLTVVTSFPANNEEREVSACCQFEPKTQGLNMEECNIICAHGMIQTVKSLSSPNRAVTTPIYNTNPWELDNTVGRQCSQGMKAHQHVSVDDSANFRFGTLGYGGFLPLQGSSSGIDVHKSVDYSFPFTCESQTHTSARFNSENLAVQSPTREHLHITKAYFEKLKEYCESRGSRL